MIKITKRSTPPQPIRAARDYQDGQNFTALAEDCYGKCYICELKSSTVNVEHRVPHRGNDSLKFDWHNLFLACGHCNNTKSDKYENILDPSICDPEEFIALSLDGDSWKEKVVIEALSDDESVRQTKALLHAVYNGGMTAQKKLECANLRNEISKCIDEFYEYLEAYQKKPDEVYDAIIKEEISRSSAFAAFKRKIVRDDVELFEKFASALR